MTNEQILKQAIEKAKKGGWKETIDLQWVKGVKFSKKDDEFSFYNYPGWVCQIIFSHDFAKAFWGEEIEPVPINNQQLYVWQYNLQQMVLEKEPLQYLKKFL